MVQTTISKKSHAAPDIDPDRDKGNDPLASWFFGARDMQRFGNQDSEPFPGIVAEPAAFETLLHAEIQAILGTFGDYGDIRAKVVEMVSLARQGYSAIPNDDSHEQFSVAKVAKRGQGILAQRSESAQRGRGEGRSLAPFGMTTARREAQENS
jgi:hypothetical protein